MAITIYGTDKLISVDTATTFDIHDIYTAVVDWAALSANMQYTLPMSAFGKAPLGGGVYSDIIYTLLNGWKLDADGYAAHTVLLINGTVVTDDNSVRTSPAYHSGNDVSWTFQVATAGVVVTSTTDPGLTASLLRIENLITAGL